ncbi:MAG: biotin transporter BioY [Clostridia bacterium]|nr:biotin transporter BioY [Clostridia bacterium]MBQ6718339.1 biotin transporter BioY [Clostridia bacterium]
MNKTKIKKIAETAIFTAIIAALSWISIFTPFGVNLTLQLFGVCLAGFYLGAKMGVVATAVYITVGAAGLPVFSSFTGGIGILFGTSGGFLWGFLASSALCGVASTQNKKVLKYLLMVLAVLICHTAGVIQFCIVSGVNMWAGFVTASLPFLVKDFILVFLADFVAKKIKIKGG